MKYMNYLINGKIIDFDKVIPEKRGYRQLVILSLIPASFIGLFALTATFPFAMFIDSLRFIKLQHLLYMRRYRAFKYYDRVLSHFIMSSEQREKVKFLMSTGRHILMDSTISDIDLNRLPLHTRTQYGLAKNSYLITEQTIQLKNIFEKNLQN